ncbi:unnamed protein product [Ixodes hexagonus]
MGPKAVASPGYRALLASEQRKRYERTPAERLLMLWVFCWMLLAAVAATVMLYLLVVMYRRPALTSEHRDLLDVRKILTRETYHSKDHVTAALLKGITIKEINNTIEILTQTPSGGHALAQGVLKYWKSNGIEETNMVKYQVLLSVPQDRRPNKLQNAERASAVALVLFLDRVESGPQEYEKVYPDSVYVSGSAIQRGTVAYYRGDPLTPGYPSTGELSSFSRHDCRSLCPLSLVTDGIHRVPLQDSSLPTIPCQPIGYDDATIFLKLHVRTNNLLVEGYAYNAIGIIRGSIEPDRYVLMGSHTAWQSRGDAQPLLALSQLVAQVKAFGRIHKLGWRPRRTMVFALWDGEADSLLGSTEWVEDHMRLLQLGAVIYIANELTTGPVFRPHATPSLSRSLRHVADLRKHFKTKRYTRLQTWRPTRNFVRRPGNISLELPINIELAQHAALFPAGSPPSVLSPLRAQHPNLTSVYPAYHTTYDNMGMIKMLDPGWKTSLLAAQTSALLARLWADRVMLPYDLTEIADFVSWGFGEFARVHGEALAYHQINLDGLQQASNIFSSNAKVFQNWADNITKENPMVVRIANDIMMQVEKVFLTPKGLPSRHITHRHLLYSPEGYPFPGMDDEISANPFNSHRFHLQLSLLTESVWQAAELLVVSPY